MEEKKVSTLFEELRDDLSGYVSDRLQLLKLQTYSKTSKTGDLLLYGLAFILLILFAVNITFVTIAIYLGEKLESMSLGFAIVSALAILVVIIIILARKAIRNSLTNIIINLLMDDDKE